MTAVAGVFSEAATPTVLEPEPPNGAYVLIGDVPRQTLYQRDDDEARNGDWGDQRWFDIGDGEDPEDWGTLARRPHERMYLRGDLTTSMVEVLDARERTGAGS